MKKINFVFTLLFFSLLSKAQQDTGHFLWFTGHWSTDKKTFITTKRTDTTAEGNIITIPGGNKVTITPSGNIQIQGPTTDEWNKKIEDGLQAAKEEEQKEQSIQTEISAYHLTHLVKPATNAIKTSFQQLKIEDASEQEKMELLAANVTDWCTRVKPKFDALVAFYKAHHKTNDDLNIPIPPEDDFTCAGCDSNVAKRNYQQDTTYVTQFIKPEGDYLGDAISIIKYLVSLGWYSSNWESGGGTVMELDSLFRYSKDPSKAGVCSYLTNSDPTLDKIVYFLSSRLNDKVWHLLRNKNYRSNIKMLTPITMAALKTEQALAILGTDDGGNAINELRGMYSTAVSKFVETLEYNHDWQQLSNVPLIWQLEKSAALLGSNSDENFIKQMGKIMNGFYLNLEMDIKTGKDGTYQLAHLKGKSKITIDFDFKADKCKNWVVADDEPDAIGFPTEKATKKIEMDLLANEQILPPQAAAYKSKYIGTKKYFVRLQNLKLDFCNPGSDTILLTGITPEPDINAGMWTVPFSKPVPGGIYGLDGNFKDINHIIQVALSGEAEQQGIKDFAMGKDKIAQMKALASQIGSNRSDPKNLEKYMQLRDMAKQTEAITNNSTIAPVDFIAFALPTQNKSNVLVEKRFDAKDFNTKAADEGIIVYGYYTVKIEYKPSK